MQDEERFVPIYRDRVSGLHKRFGPGREPDGTVWADYARMYYEQIPADGLELAAQLIWDERQRQVVVEGYTIDHDVHHGTHALVAAAKVYVGDTDARWPWAPQFLKPRGELRDLVRAGALLKAAEAVDRIENPWRDEQQVQDFRAAVAARAARAAKLTDAAQLAKLNAMPPTVGVRPGNPDWHVLQDRIERKLALILCEAAAVFGVPVEKGQGA